MKRFFAQNKISIFCVLLILAVFFVTAACGAVIL